jgi:hypothetical protein
MVTLSLHTSLFVNRLIVADIIGVKLFAIPLQIKVSLFAKSSNDTVVSRDDMGAADGYWLVAATCFTIL